MSFDLPSGGNRIMKTRQPEMQNAAAHGFSPRRGRIPGGFWYFVIPILTLGWLSAIPFIHAALRLRDRKVLLLAGVYAVGGSLAFSLLANAQVDARGGVDWRGPAGLWLGIFVAGLACYQLFVLRRRVYLAAPRHRDPPHDAATEAAASESNPQKDRRRIFSDIVDAILGIGGLLGLVFVALVLPPLIIRETISQTGSKWIYGGHPSLYAAYWAAFALFCAGGLLFWFVVLYDPKEGKGLQIISFLIAIFGNLWLGFGIWLLAVKLFHISLAASDPGRFGRMVWWNLVDSVPVLDIDTVLDWERPMEEYSSSIGWLLIVQRIVLLLTLARSIQVVVSTTLSSAAFFSVGAAERRQQRRESRRARKGGVVSPLSPQRRIVADSNDARKTPD
jgi:hypothetical protein